VPSEADDAEDSDPVVFEHPEKLNAAISNVPKITVPVLFIILFPLLFHPWILYLFVIIFPSSRRRQKMRQCEKQKDDKIKQGSNLIPE